MGQSLEGQQFSKMEAIVSESLYLLRPHDVSERSAFPFCLNPSRPLIFFPFLEPTKKKKKNREVNRAAV